MILIIKFGELLLWISQRIINVLRRYITLWKESFIRYPNTSKLVKKNLAAPRFFNPPLSDWISDETPFLMFDIFHKLHKDRPIDLYGKNNLTSWRGLLVSWTSSNYKPANVLRCVYDRIYVKLSHSVNKLFGYVLQCLHLFLQCWETNYSKWTDCKW